MILNERQLNANKVIDSNGCWIWQGAFNTAGYGTVYWYGRDMIVSRLSLAISSGVMPRGHQACHTCDVVSCFNPSHLYWGTHEDNAKDRIGKKFFDGNCMRGHSQKLYSKPGRPCIKCEKLLYIVKKLNNGGKLSSSNKIVLTKFDIDFESPDFETFLKDFI